LRQALQKKPSSLNRTAATPEIVSVAESEIVALRMLVHAAPPAMAIVPVGGLVSTTIESLIVAETLPAPSRYCA
jgi:hypothetical protein